MVLVSVALPHLMALALLIEALVVSVHWKRRFASVQQIM